MAAVVASSAIPGVGDIGAAARDRTGRASPDFSTARVLDHIRVIAAQPHPMGSAANARVRDYIVAQAKRLGVPVELQKGTAVTCCSHAGEFIGGTPENIVARVSGTGESRKALLLASHYDSVATAPGAGDAAAGVAVILETMRMLANRPPLRNDVIFLFTDGEEPGMLGSRLFIDEHRWANDVAAVLNMEGGGNRGHVFVFQTSDRNGRLIRELAAAAPRPMGTSEMSSCFRLSGSDTDFTVFSHRGWPGLNIAFFEGATHYHTALDTVEALHRRSVDHLGSYAASLVPRLGNVDLAQLNAPSVVYFDVFATLVRYPRAHASPLAAAAVLLCAMALAAGFRNRRLSAPGVAGGAAALIASSVLAGVAAWGIWSAAVRSRGGAWAFEYHSWWWWAGFAALGVAAAAASFALVRKKIAAEAVAAGALLPWLFLTLITSWRLPEASYMFLGPLVFSAVALLGLFWMGGDRRGAFPALVVFAAFLPGVLLFVSVIHRVTIIRGLFLEPAIPAVAGMVALLTGTVLAHLAIVFRVDAKRIAIAGSVALGIFFAVGLALAGYDGERPRANTIFYAMDADAKRAIWGSYDDDPDPWTTQFLGDRPQRATMPTYGLSSPAVLHRSASVVELPVPRVNLLKDEMRESRRDISLLVTAPAGARFVTVATDVEAAEVRAELNGRAIPAAKMTAGSDPGLWVMRYWDPPPDGFELAFSLAPGRPLTVRVTSGSPGLPRSAGTQWKPRGPDSMPRRREDTTFVSKSFNFGAASRITRR